MTSRDPQRRETLLAWIAALDASCDTLCRHRGRPRIDSSTTLTLDEHRMAWDAAATLAAGVAALARECLRHGVTWAEILELAHQEHVESLRHLPSTVARRD